MEKYTTQALITADKTGEEIKKIVLSNDAYAISEMIDNLMTEVRRKQ